MHLETLLATCEISDFEFKFSSMITLKKSVSFTWSIFWLLIKSWIVWFVRFWDGLNAMTSVKLCYYSFKIFPLFWLAKSTRIIHHNQLQMTKFGRILCLMRKWCQKCSLLQVNVPLNEKTWGWGWVVLVVKTNMADTSLVSRVRTAAGTRRNNG